MGHYTQLQEVRACLVKMKDKRKALILCKKTSYGKIISIIGFDLRDKGLTHYKHDIDL